MYEKCRLYFNDFIGQIFAPCYH